MTMMLLKPALSSQVVYLARSYPKIVSRCHFLNLNGTEVHLRKWIHSSHRRVLSSALAVSLHSSPLPSFSLAARSHAPRHLFGNSSLLNATQPSRAISSVVLPITAPDDSIHWILKAIGWGVLLPTGVIISRYVKVFLDPGWFYAHVGCQVSGYIIGLVGWGVGLKIGSKSFGTTFDSYSSMGIALLGLVTLQAVTSITRPSKEHKYRNIWNMYHHLLGYSTVLLSVIYNLKGFDIFDPAKKWKPTYIGVLVALVGIAVLLEAITWPIVLKRGTVKTNTMLKKEGPVISNKEKKDEQFIYNPEEHIQETRRPDQAILQSMSGRAHHTKPANQKTRNKTKTSHRLHFCIS